MSFYPAEPVSKRAVAFMDGQNLFHSVKSAFRYFFPNYDAKKLAEAVCARQGWELAETRFYTGIPNPEDNQFWQRFWTLKIGAMRRQENVFVYSRPFRYRAKEVPCGDGTAKQRVMLGEEKGIDVRIAIDVIRMAHKKTYDVALLFSQDQDLSEVADEIRDIAREQNRWIKIACAFPRNLDERLNRGVNKTDWLPFDKDLYSRCVDPHDYRQDFYPAPEPEESSERS